MTNNEESPGIFPEFPTQHEQHNPDVTLIARSHTPLASQSMQLVLQVPEETVPWWQIRFVDRFIAVFCRVLGYTLQGTN